MAGWSLYWLYLVIIIGYYLTKIVVLVLVFIHQRSSGRNVLCGLSHSWSWHGPQTVVRGSAYCLHEQQSVLQAVEQLQWMTFKRLSGATIIVDISGINLLSWRCHPQFRASIPSSVQANLCTFHQRGQPLLGTQGHLCGLVWDSESLSTSLKDRITYFLPVHSKRIRQGDQ